MVHIPERVGFTMFDDHNIRTELKAGETYSFEYTDAQFLAAEGWGKIIYDWGAKLPEGKTCSDCKSWETYCKEAYKHKDGSETTCMWMDLKFH